jgi:hypothetical protein
VTTPGARTTSRAAERRRPNTQWKEHRLRGGSHAPRNEMSPAWGNRYQRLALLGSRFCHQAASNLHELPMVPPAQPSSTGYNVSHTYPVDSGRVYR